MGGCGVVGVAGEEARGDGAEGGEEVVGEDFKRGQAGDKRSEDYSETSLFQAGFTWENARGDQDWAGRMRLTVTPI